MADTQETIYIIKKAPILRNSQNVITKVDLERQIDVKARYTRKKAIDDCKKANANPNRKFDYGFKRLKLS